MQSDCKTGLQEPRALKRLWCDQESNVFRQAVEERGTQKEEAPDHREKGPLSTASMANC